MMQLEPIDSAPWEASTYYDDDWSGWIYDYQPMNDQNPPAQIPPPKEQP